MTGRTAARAALGCGVASVLGLAGTAALGDSAAVPGLGPGTVLPPWDVAAGPSSALVTALLAVAWTLAAATVLLGLVALRRNGFGWDGRRTALLAAAAVLALVVVPPLGSADHLSYAAYGRIMATGGDPYVTAPDSWRGGGDPVAGAVQPPWQSTTSVYGPVATAAQTLAAVVGDGSLRRTVWAWQVLAGLAFLGTGLALDRLAVTLARRRRGPGAGDDAADDDEAGDDGNARAATGHARARVAVLWTLNPLLLGQLVLGAHVDVLAAAFAAGALALAVRRPFVAGALVAAAVATKAPFALVGLALVWGVRQLPRRQALGHLAIGALGAGLVLLPAHLWTGPNTYDQLQRASRFVSFATPWRLLVDQLDPLLGRGPVRSLVTPLAAVLAVALAVLLARRVAALLASSGARSTPTPTWWPSSGGRSTSEARSSVDDPPEDGAAMTRDAVAALAVTSLGWVLTAPYALPWYDCLAWLPLVLLASSGLDLAMLGRLWVLALAYVPGRVVGMSPDVEAFTLGFRRHAAPWLTLATLCWVVWWAAASWRASASGRTHPAAPPGPSPSAGPAAGAPSRGAPGP
ncbi:hypothetical protein [Kineosporia sp. A_224]|uniref:hypothetical protein n=1 Tax=Kineosporia sp. A_224 TaxID=1962180 RepID=UPI001E4E19EF|nr:hypothetical protein [Kineosporia sp. A_224]